MAKIVNITENDMTSQEVTTMSGESSQDSYALNNALLYMIFIVGVPSNLSIVYLVLTVRQLRSHTNVILCLMCAADLFMIAGMVPYELISSHPDSLVIMNLHIFFNFFVCGLSIFSLVMLSYDRRNAVTNPFHSEQTFTSTAIKLFVIVLLSALVAVPNYFNLIEDSDHGGYVIDHWKFLVPGTFVILYLLPLLSIAILYTHMAITLCRGRKRIGESIKRNRKIGKTRNKTAIIVICLVVLFAICWFPFFYVLLHDTIIHIKDHEFNYSEDFAFRNFSNDWKVSFCLMNSVFDPISIFVLGSRYRHHLVQIYPFRIIRKACCKTRKKEPRTELTKQSKLSGGSYYRPITRSQIKKEDV